MGQLFRRVSSTLFLILAIPVAAWADRDADLARLGEVLRLDEMFEIMAEEGEQYGANLEEQLFGGKGGASWQQDVRDIYDEARLEEGFWILFSEAMSDETISDTLTYFDTPLGGKIVESELLARRAFLDPAVEEASAEVVEGMIHDQDPFLITLREYAKVNDLVDSNVVSSMNAQFAFMNGLVRGGAIPSKMTEDDILRDIYSQEPDIRADTSKWIMSFLTLAYRPMTEAELRSNIDFGRTESGQSFNNALFTSFDEVFKGISEALGVAAAVYITSQDI